MLRALQTCETEFGLRHVTDSEAAYLVLYLQRGVEQRRLDQRPRVTVVCSMGRSTAYFLHGRLQESFPNWDIVGVLGTRELEQRLATGDLGRVDFFVSTVPLPPVPVPVAIVSPLLSDRDLEVLLEAAETALGGAS